MPEYFVCTINSYCNLQERQVHECLKSSLLLAGNARVFVRGKAAFFVTPKSYTRIDLSLFPFAMRESCDKIGVLFGAFALGGETAKRGSKER